MQKSPFKRTSFLQSFALVLGLLLICRFTAMGAKEFLMPDAHPARTYPAHDERPMEKVTVAVDP